MYFSHSVMLSCVGCRTKSVGLFVLLGEHSSAETGRFSTELPATELMIFAENTLTISLGWSCNRTVSFFKNIWVKNKQKNRSFSDLTAFSLGPPVSQFIVAVQAAGSGIGPQELSQEAVLCWISSHRFPAGFYVGCWVNISITGSERVSPQVVAAIQHKEVLLLSIHVDKMLHSIEHKEMFAVMSMNYEVR